MKIYRDLTYELTSTKLCNSFTNILYKESCNGYTVGLKPI